MILILTEQVKAPVHFGEYASTFPFFFKRFFIICCFISDKNKFRICKESLVFIR